MSVAVNDLFLATVWGSCFGQRTILTNWYAIAVIDPNISEATAATSILDAIRAAGGGDKYETALRACMPPEWTLDFIQVQKVQPVRYVSTKVSRGVAGTHAGSCETVNQSSAISFTTLLAGRDQIATKKVGPLPLGATVQADGYLVAAYKTLLGTLAAGMQSTIVDVAIGMSAYQCIAHKTPAGSYTINTSWQVGDTIRVNRRRTVGVGV